MHVNQQGIDLIKRFEGFRAKAYRCPAGVWTIGYGHTSAAGKPEVKPGLVIDRDAAALILRDDVQTFADGVRAAVTAPLNDNQFSALVSFAYNVGLGAFRSSSVLKAVNRGDYDEVPRRLALWTKAQGRVLPGLVKRRAAEAHLWADDPAGDFDPIDNSARDAPDTPKPAPPVKQDAAAIGTAAGGTAVAHWLGVDWKWLAFAAMALGLAYLAWRMWRSAKEDGDGQ